MSVRWMAVQYIGDTLRIPVANESDMDRPFGSSMLERDVRRIVVNPFSDSPQVFVPEAENAKLREDMEDLEGYNQKLRDMLWQVTELKVKADFENAKLRELVQDMYSRFHGVVIENWSYSSEDFYTYEQRMRELGVVTE